MSSIAGSTRGTRRLCRASPSSGICAASSSIRGRSSRTISSWAPSVSATGSRRRPSWPCRPRWTSCSSRRTRGRSSAGRPSEWWRRSATPWPMAVYRGNPCPSPSSECAHSATASLALRSSPQRSEKGLDLGPAGQCVLRAPLGAAERGGGAGEGDGLLERAPRRETHGQSAVEGIAGRRGIHRRDGKGRIVRGARRVAREDTLGSQGHEHGARAPLEQGGGRRARRLERVDGEAAEPRGLPLVGREVVHQLEEGVVDGLDGGGVEYGGDVAPARLVEGPADDGHRRLELADDHIGPGDALDEGRGHLDRQLVIGARGDPDLVLPIGVYEDERRARGRLRSLHAAFHPYARLAQGLAYAAPVRIGAHAAYHPHLAAEPTSGHGLIGALATQIDRKSTRLN